MHVSTLLCTYVDFQATSASGEANISQQLTELKLEIVARDAELAQVPPNTHPLLHSRLAFVLTIIITQLQMDRAKEHFASETRIHELTMKIAQFEHRERSRVLAAYNKCQDEYDHATSIDMRTALSEHGRRVRGLISPANQSRATLTPHTPTSTQHTSELSSDSGQHMVTPVQSVARRDLHSADSNPS